MESVADLKATPTIRFGVRFAAALAFACRSHDGQFRKGSGAPYITHPLAVASLVGEYGGDEDQAIAGLCHDLMEDCGVTYEQLSEAFGARVAGIVQACTDTVIVPKPAWRPRKEAHLAHIADEPADVKLVMAADKLHNATSILHDLHRPTVGDLVWSRFSASRAEVLWYYRSLADALAQGWEHEILGELARAVRSLDAP
ncbi:MAG: bifunctional (p)ppGpp synthetase/guanosine-3',5'-bis(diphosphate) 3'-pyrophosphohydrolase [Myxococcales bacterium]|nr:bifunctional (p)ppGpp synthetase/guanosine-3',5'-bis(diphosphate) 3'-pyrophosphohydrolase [Myxococcales bacterium]